MSRHHKTGMTASERVQSKKSKDYYDALAKKNAKKAKKEEAAKK